MKKLIFIALAATSAIAATAPASAQSGRYDGGYANGNANGQIGTDQLQMRLQAGIRSGAISRSEAMPLREQLRQLTRLEMLYARDGISGRERADLQQRTNTLRQGIRMAERGADGRWGGDDRYGNDDGRYGNDNGRYGNDDSRYGRGDVDSRYDRDNDGWDDRDGNRDGRWDVDARNDANRDGYDDRDYNRDGRWDNDEGYRQTDGRGVIGQVIDRVTGTGGLRVGQRASADLGGVPYAYRTQFRDGEGVYYRSDGRQIYQIDARTQTVVRIYAINR
ncbi:MAG: hypothetical protein QOJ91_1474 [Sphingomonadales bacterium]|jgi:hypothetical protein|nr:hypothetical protein [Sphingomonadales bacterium]